MSKQAGSKHHILLFVFRSSKVAVMTSTIHPQSLQDLTRIIQESFQSLQEKYKEAETEVLQKMTETGKAFENVENALSDLMDHSGVNDQDSDDEEDNEL